MKTARVGRRSPVEAAGPVDAQTAVAHRTLEIAKRFPQLPQGRRLALRPQIGENADRPRDPWGHDW